MQSICLARNVTFVWKLSLIDVAPSKRITAGSCEYGCNLLNKDNSPIVICKDFSIDAPTSNMLVSSLLSSSLGPLALHS
jgi:hypothetical protein